MAAALLHHDDTNPCETERWRHVNEEPTPPAQLQQSVSKPSTGLQKSETTPKPGASPQHLCTTPFSLHYFPPDAGSQAGCLMPAGTATASGTHLPAAKTGLEHWGEAGKAGRHISIQILFLTFPRDEKAKYLIASFRSFLYTYIQDILIDNSYIKAQAPPSYKKS